ncbi:MAG: zinc ABC transporter substrate-binding protein [Micavibrio aeruginosavorus]|uniref:Zinc ABC transporter substrate-binding protein n=1 Tax=Micavibrio aeruginosavorus TaxID=349221 RepID=A0A7T5UGC4_9BACT|nr:MAG: zinc ABC transporter substrate-binding protein [Micavibrio aeruginosavorus]
MKKILIISLCVAGLAGLGLHSLHSWAATPDRTSGRPQIVTTTAQVADAVRAVTGDLAQVESLMGEGVDPHLYRPTRSDIMKLKAADIVFYNGLHLEGQMVELLEKLTKEKPVFAIAAMLPSNRLLDGPNGHDPHIWMNAQNWISASDGIALALSGLHPQHQETYMQNARDYSAKLEELDIYIRESFSRLPVKSRILVTAHDAFAYLGEAYGLQVTGIQGISTESEAGLKKIEELVDLLVENRIPAVFIESSVSDRNIRALIEGAAARGHQVKIGGTLYSDAMGATGTYEGTYIGMMDHNATTISRALGAATPPQGLQGKLSLASNQHE